MRRKLKVGDVVRLNSGSDKLTVVYTEGDDVSVVWMSADNTATRALIPIACVTLEPESYL
jgi:uncharacterized protein YodC (DUF2158 family)